MQPVRFILVGGFLGAGKTTLLGQAARRLAERGKRVGLITNDQAAELVDSCNLREQGFAVNEVAGGCFCCRFEDLLKSARDLVGRGQPDILLGEPVGSCTDLSATVLQPLKSICCVEFAVSPFSVVADVRRVRDLLSGQAKSLFPDSVLYIYSKQIEEADQILLNKADLLSADEVEEVRAKLTAAYPGVHVRTISARTGEGVDEWLESVLDGQPAGQRIAEVDYDVYADGEAELGWLNARVDLSASGGADWPALARRLMETLRKLFATRHAEVAHLKVFLTASGGSIVGSLTRTADEALFLSHGSIDPSAAHAELIINARVHLAPELLKTDVETMISGVLGNAMQTRVRSIESFRPGRPRPTHRFSEVVNAPQA